MMAAALMVIVVSAQVFLRYVMNDFLDWADEVSRLAFVATIFLAIPLGIRDGTHVGIGILVERMPAGTQMLISRIMALIAGCLMIVMAQAAVVVAAATWSERLGSIDLTSSVFFFPVIVGSIHSALHLLHLAVFPIVPGPSLP